MSVTKRNDTEVRLAYRWAWQDARRSKKGRKALGNPNPYNIPAIQAVAQKSLDDRTAFELRQDNLPRNFTAVIKDVLVMEWDDIAPSVWRHRVLNVQTFRNNMQVHNMQLYGDGYRRFARRWSWANQALGGDVDDYLDWRRRLAYGH